MPTTKKHVKLTREMAQRLYERGIGANILYTEYEDENLKETWELLNKAQIAYEDAHKKIREELFKNENVKTINT